MPLATDVSNDTLTLRLTGDWSIDHVAEIEKAFADLPKGRVARVRVDSSQLKAFDLSTAWLLRTRVRELTSQNAKLEFVGQQPSHFAFIDELTKVQSSTAAQPGDSDEPITKLVGHIGRFGIEHVRRARSGLEFYGRSLVTALAAIPHPKRLRGTSIVRHVYETGIQAIPIVALIAFLITLVIAYIGAQQL